MHADGAPAACVRVMAGLPLAAPEAARPAARLAAHTLALLSGGAPDFASQVRPPGAGRSEGRRGGWKARRPPACRGACACAFCALFMPAPTSMAAAHDASQVPRHQERAGPIPLYAPVTLCPAPNRDRALTGCAPAGRQGRAALGGAVCAAGRRAGAAGARAGRRARCRRPRQHAAHAGRARRLARAPVRPPPCIAPACGGASARSPSGSASRCVATPIASMLPGRRRRVCACTCIWACCAAAVQGTAAAEAHACAAWMGAGARAHAALPCTYAHGRGHVVTEWGPTAHAWHAALCIHGSYSVLN